MNAIACIHWYWRPELNPYRPVQAIIVLLLAAGFYGWQQLRAKPSMFTVAYMSVAWIVMMGGVGSMLMTDLDSATWVCGVVLQSSVVLTAFVYLELWRAWRRRPIAEAIARYPS